MSVYHNLNGIYPYLKPEDKLILDSNKRAKSIIHKQTYIPKQKHDIDLESTKMWTNF